MRRLAGLGLLALTYASGSHAQGQVPRIEVDPKRVTSFERPVIVRPGELVASEISDTDFNVGPGWNSEQFTVTGRAGETITVQLKSDIPTLEAAIRPGNHGAKAAVEGPARGQPLRYVLPKDGTYFIIVHAKGPQRQGRYLMSIGSGDSAPPFEPPKAAVQVAQAQKPAPAPAAKPPPPPPPALPKLTPPPGVIAAEFGKPIARPAGKPGVSVDLFQFIGEAGAVVDATAAGVGGYGVTLFTPEGAEMLTATGMGSSKLKAVLPQDAVYTLAVTRQDGAKPYKLSLASEAPDIFLWGFREFAGYETLGADGKVAYWTCWAEPGAALRYNLASGGVQTLRVSRGGAGQWALTVQGQPGGYRFTTKFDGTKFVRTSESGQVATWSQDERKPHGRYRGYLCP